MTFFFIFFCAKIKKNIRDTWKMKKNDWIWSKRGGTKVKEITWKQELESENHINLVHTLVFNSHFICHSKNILSHFSPHLLFALFHFLCFSHTYTSIIVWKKSTKNKIIIIAKLILSLLLFCLFSTSFQLSW